ncbi:MAG: MurT ligase domain-containing protein [Sciscionella sp.]
MSLRATLAMAAGRCAAHTSRLVGFGGHMIGGRVALMLHPGCLSELAADRRVVLVSGTNGKTTTTAMLSAALRTEGPVVSNASGANMLDGLTTALASDDAPTVVGEIDELYLPQAVAQTNPQALVLLNLSRDQLDRAHEIRHTALRMRRLAERFPELLVVANCDDPYVAFVATAFTNVVWVAAGTGWREDSANCPGCGQGLVAGGAGDHCEWACVRCGLSRPVPHWRPSQRALTTSEGNSLGTPLVAPDGSLLPLTLRLPGAVNRANAAMAIAAAHALGIAPEQAVSGVAEVAEAAGRYRTVRVGEHQLQLMLAKNPSGWAATLDMICAQPAPVIISVNAAEADGRDTSWLYDVAFERLAGHQVVAAGDRAADLGTRLSYAGTTHTTISDPLAALEEIPPGQVVFVGDYTSFQRLLVRTGRN